MPGPTGTIDGGIPVYTAPYFRVQQLSEIIEPAVQDAVEGMLPTLVPPYVDAAVDTAVAEQAVLLSGSTMTGALYLSGLPTAGTQAASKTYVDNAVLSGGIPEVPSSPAGQSWARQTGAWVALANVGLPSTGLVLYDTMAWTGAAWVNVRPKYNLGFSFVGGLLGASQLLGLHNFTKAVTFNPNFSGYLGHVPMAGGTANATASTTIAVEKAIASAPNTFSGIGTVAISAGGVVATFATSGGAAVSFAMGDILRLVGPATPDATFANFYCSLVGRET